jgi:hypothetical protein
VILLDCSTGASLWRYFRRVRNSPARVGGLGTTDTVNWEMVRYILQVSPRNRRRYRAIFDEFELPKVDLRNRRELSRFYQAERLTRSIG